MSISSGIACAQPIAVSGAPNLRQRPQEMTRADTLDDRERFPGTAINQMHYTPASFSAEPGIYRKICELLTRVNKFWALASRLSHVRRFWDEEYNLTALL